MKTWIKLGVPLALGAAVLVGWLVSDSDEARIRKGMARVMAAIEKTGPETPVAAVRRAGEAADEFMESCEVRIDRAELGPVASRNELRQTVFRLRGMLDELRVSLHDESVELDPDGAAASQHFTARARARHQEATEEVVKEIAVLWQRTPDGWRIRSVGTIEAIRPVR